MADERGLDGLDPYDLMDGEAARIASWFAGLDEAGLTARSACEGWTRRDVLAHLAATEEYHRACLEGTVRDLIARLVDSGAASLDDMNAAGVAAQADMTTGALLAAWEAANAANRAGFRAADGTDIDSSAGSYPARAQAFHVAFELAIHADDVDAPVLDAEADARQRWMAGVAWFALTEIKDDVTVEAGDDGYVVRGGDHETVLDRGSFIAGVSGREASPPLSDADAELLSLGY